MIKAKLQNKVPFGVDIAVKKVIEALNSEVAPKSTIFKNLIILKKSPLFPEELIVDYFLVNRDVEQQELVCVRKVLDDIKMPNINLISYLKDFVLDGWVQKRKKKVESSINRKTPSNKKPQKTIAKAKKKTEQEKPTVVVKKSFKHLLDKSWFLYNNFKI